MRAARDQLAAPHLWLALSPHGFGHAAMTASVVAELRRLVPGLRLTIQTTVPHEFLTTRYEFFEYVPEIADFGLRMTSATGIDLEASAAGYRALHADFPGLVAHEADRLRRAAPDLLLSNVAYVPLAAAAEAGIPAAAMSSLNWADIYGHYLGDRPEASIILKDMRAAYGRAAMFLRCIPAQEMTLPNLRDIGPIGQRGTERKRELAQALGLGQGTRIGLIAFGGIDHTFPLGEWPILPGWMWLSTLADIPERSDMVDWRRAGLAFSDLMASVDLAVTKPGYGTFTEAAMAGTAVLYVPRPDWPECPHLESWLAAHTRALPATTDELCGPALPLLLQKLFSLSKPRVAEPSGVAEAVASLVGMLAAEGDVCARS